MRINIDWALEALKVLAEKHNIPLTKEEAVKAGKEKYLIICYGNIFWKNVHEGGVDVAFGLTLRKKSAKELYEILKALTNCNQLY